MVIDPHKNAFLPGGKPQWSECVIAESVKCDGKGRCACFGQRMMCNSYMKAA